MRTSTPAQARRPKGEPAALELATLTNKLNPRQHHDPGPLRELADSIAEHGILERILVRKGGLEIIDGGRRAAAAKLAGLPVVPCEVLDVTIEVAAELALVCNLQREDMDPIDEAAAIEALLRDGAKVGELARQLGKSATFVARRRRIAGLLPKWVKAWKGGKLEAWSPAMLEELSVLEPDSQAEVWKARGYIRDLEDLARRVQELTCALSRAPWALDDETLLPKAGSCTACAKHSAHAPGLFDEPDGVDDPKAATCLDGACWAKKLLAHRDRALELARAEHGAELLLLSGGWNGGGPGASRLKFDPKGGRVHYHLPRSKRGAKGAAPAFIVDGAGAGRVTWVRKPGVRAPKHSSSPAAKKAAEPSPKERLAASLDRIKRRRAAWTVDHVRERLRDADPGDVAARLADELLVRLVAVFGAAGLHPLRHSNPRKALKDPSPALEQRVMVVDAVLANVGAALVRHNPVGVLIDRALALLLAEVLLGVPKTELEAAALEAVPDPKNLPALRRAAAAKKKVGEKKPLRGKARTTSSSPRSTKKKSPNRKRRKR